ncbi:hypothetical protein GLAREA_13090 [Glarea lozoyensis ATCC 20868]|uniref:Uncharacterized protein n=1 Tax=Glarea lozoyensis (strain ATCC 20868 / MF5171) TaxID=1116229 RepID=S3CUF4_GLAL2|nr:uncharacterized protein GLAREA_13090 [Glarea lozoyensis ATCC 20868]EPE30042.1 hypothetical protein GLAREA_13090 [Glarea lozoyensis ATCC 20868]
MKENVFRGAAGPEVDDAWKSLGTDYLPIILPENEAEEYGLRLGQVKRRQDQGGGFFANVEVLHHLHCLNLLRKASHFSYEYYHSQGEGPFANDDEVIWLHFGHCLDILRQQLMCSAGVGVFGQYWIADPPGPFVDFNTKHKCKNFGAIREWAEKNQVTEEDNSRVEFRPGDIVLPEIP